MKESTFCHENDHTVRKNVPAATEKDVRTAENGTKMQENDHTVRKKRSFPCEKTGKDDLPATDKITLRRRLIAARNATPPNTRQERDEKIVRRVAALSCFKEATAVLLYVPNGSEIDVRPLAREAWRRKIPVGLPVCDRANKTLTFRRALPDVPLIEGAYGIPVPSENAETITPDEKTVCVLPALAYDEKRVRLGYGGGYYDRFLVGFQGVAVGVAYTDTVLESVFAEPHDRRADILVTETDIFR